MPFYMCDISNWNLMLCTGIVSIPTSGLKSNCVYMEIHLLKMMGINTLRFPLRLLRVENRLLPRVCFYTQVEYLSMLLKSEMNKGLTGEVKFNLWAENSHIISPWIVGSIGTDVDESRVHLIYITLCCLTDGGPKFKVRNCEITHTN